LIITLNEERNIERAIKSVQSFADEIIVLDSLSTDKTKEICLQFNEVQFIEKAWKGYSETKNHLHSLAKYSYILSLDADEAPDKEMIQEIIKRKREGLSGVYQVNRLTNYCGKWIKNSGWYPDIKKRLFPTDSAKWDGEIVHEELVFDKDYTSKLLKGHLLHYSYYDYKDHRERADRYSLLTAQKFHSKGKKANICKPILSGFTRFFSMYIVKKGFLDGKMGFKIATISAQSNILKYKELRRLNKSK
jgi:glycosyltransferase involved in cell wall biosynthesis